MKALITRFVFILTMLMAAVTAQAQDASLKLIPPGTVIEGRRFNVTLRLSNGQANAPQPPKLTGCELRYGPSVSTMSSTQIINGQMSSSMSTDFTYVYEAVKAGTVTIPSMTVSVGGKTLRSAQASFTILPADKAQQSSGGRQNQVVVDDVSTQTPGKVSPNDLLVRISFSKSHVYEQEPVIATIKVYTKYAISSFLVTTQPVFDGFLSEDLPVNLDVTKENYNGQNYYAAVLKRCILYPQKSGKLTVNSGKYAVTVEQYETVNMGFFQTYRPVERKVTTSSNAASLTVDPLPQPAPAAFDGAVGQFTVDTSLSPDHLRTGEAATFTYTVKGTGNIKYLKEPKISFPAGIDQYTPKTDINANVTGSNTTGTYSVIYTLMPQEVGKFTIPAIDFVYFDPVKRQYVETRTEAHEIAVAKGAGTSTANTEQKAIDADMDDIRHINPVTGDLVHNVDRTFYSAGYWLLYLLVAAAFAGVIVAYRRHLKFNADVKGKRLARANRVAAKRLRAARDFMKSHRNEEFYEELSRALWGYVSDKLGIQPSQLMRDNISSQLLAYGAQQDDVDRVIAIIDECEMARFTPAHSDSEVAQLYDDAVAAIKNLENVNRRTAQTAKR